MKNLSYFVIDEMQEFNLIKQSKTASIRNRLDIITNRISNYYNIYLNQFNNIENIISTNFSDIEKSDLNSCFSGKTKVRNNLLKRIIENQNVYFKHICPYCLYNNRSTFDHYIPEGNFPEYSILVRNLIPCCSTCNSKKKEFWRNAGERKIIHFYNDIIPSVKFLNAVITLNDKNIPIINYSLIKTDEIEDEMFDIIEGHYSRLGLLDVYRTNSDLIVSTIVDDILNIRSVFGDNLSTDKICQIILKKSSTLKINFGINYWQAVAMDTLATTPQFINNI